MLIPTLSLFAFIGGNRLLKNEGFEASAPAEFWQIDGPEPKEEFSVGADTAAVKEGKQSLLISAAQPTHLSLRQDVFLPVGTLWRVTAWVKSNVSANSRSDEESQGPQIAIETPSGDQGAGQHNGNSEEWQEQSVLFRVPPPGRVTVTLRALRHQSGKVWFDDVRLQPVEESMRTEESVTIANTRISDRPIDIKQGGQFIEPLNGLLPSMISQQVDATSFEEESPWTQGYKREIDKPYRPWYPDGSVHLAKYSLDTENPYNGKRSQKIELPAAHTWAGISQDGFYLEKGHSYRLKLHLRSEGDVRVRASLHGGGGVIAGPVSLGQGTADWRGSDVVLTADRSLANATLTIEFQGPGTLWLDRIYLIDKDAVLGIWRPDVVEKLKAMNPGVVRFGGSTMEVFEWDKTIGSWDTRVPYDDFPWGGLDANFIGVEEFTQLIRYIGAEPLICLRFTGKTPEDAAAEIEYFNGDAKTKWGQERARNGHREPYHIKYWQIGNEVGGAQYDGQVKAFAEAMRKVDPSIKILSSFPSAETLRLGGGYLDYLCPHHYSVGDLGGTEKNFQLLQKEISQYANGRDVRVAVTEWNASAGEWGLGRGIFQTLGNALSCSRYQNLMHRYSSLVEIANRSNLSDSFGSGVIQPGPGWIYLTPTYFSQGLYQRAAGSFPLRITRKSELSGYLQEPDLSATLSADGKTLRIYAVNTTKAKRKIHFELQNLLSSTGVGKAFEVGDSSDDPDSEAVNSHDDPNRISLKTQGIECKGGNFGYEFKPLTVTLLEIEVQAKN